MVQYCNKKVWWKCKRGHEWKTSILHRSSGRGCPYCCKIELKDGTICDSVTEAYFYLDLKRKDIKFNYHTPIGLGHCVCDFYLPKNNQYIEVTGFGKHWKYWGEYRKNISRKRIHVVEKLKANFQFIQMKLTQKQIQCVRNNSM